MLFYSGWIGEKAKMFKYVLSQLSTSFSYFIIFVSIAVNFINGTVLIDFPVMLVLPINWMVFLFYAVRNVGRIKKLFFLWCVVNSAPLFVLLDMERRMGGVDSFSSPLSGIEFALFVMYFPIDILTYPLCAIEFLAYSLVDNNFRSFNFGSKISTYLPVNSAISIWIQFTLMMGVPILVFLIVLGRSWRSGRQ